MNEPYTISEPDADGIAIMTVRGQEFRISKQSLPDAEWLAKLQAKANLFAEGLE